MHSKVANRFELLAAIRSCSTYSYMAWPARARPGCGLQSVYCLCFLCSVCARRRVCTLQPCMHAAPDAFCNSRGPKENFQHWRLMKMNHYDYCRVATHQHAQRPQHRADAQGKERKTDLEAASATPASCMPGQRGCRLSEK